MPLFEQKKESGAEQAFNAIHYSKGGERYAMGRKGRKGRHKKKR